LALLYISLILKWGGRDQKGKRKRKKGVYSLYIRRRRREKKKKGKSGNRPRMEHVF